MPTNSQEAEEEEEEFMVNSAVCLNVDDGHGNRCRLCTNPTVPFNNINIPNQYLFIYNYINHNIIFNKNILSV